MKTLVFDTGPIINFTINGLLWALEGLKQEFNGEFYITPEVYNELINKPLSTRKYKLEALQVLPYITKGTLKVYNNLPMIGIAKEIADYANHSFEIDHQPIEIVHAGEMEAVAAAISLNADAIVIDERTTRHLIENPKKIAWHLETTIHRKVFVNWQNLDKIKEQLNKLNVIRSTELVTIAYEKGLLDRLTENAKKIVPDINKAVLEGALWGVKLNGCSVKEDEITDILKMEK
jgi:predicted nucleic acid-binding protein